MALEPLTAAVTADGNVTATLTEATYLTAAIAGIGTISTATLTTTTKLRTTQQIAQVLYNTDPKLRITQQVTQVLYNTDPKLRTTQQIVQILYTEHTIGSQLLTASITASATIEGDLKSPKFISDINGAATVNASITGIWQFSADITATGALDASLSIFVLFTSGVTVSGDITTANLRKNIEYLTADITATGDITQAILNVPWHGGSTLVDLEQSVDVEIVYSRSVENTLNLQQEVELIFGQRSFYPSNTILFTQEVEVIRVLPTKTASNTLNLTQVLSEYREVISYLILQQEAIGVIDFIEASASNVLSLTGSVSAAGTVFNLEANNQLNLTQSADWEQIQTKTLTSSLNLRQNVYPILLATKKYVLLQAPFDLIQTSVVLPNPLLDDNEGLVSNLTLRRSMNNVARTYVKTSKNRRLRYTFVMNRLKALELQAFCNSYNGADIKMINWKGELWKVKLITNPIDFVQTRRHEPGGARTDVNLEFEGVMLSG